MAESNKAKDEIRQPLLAKRQALKPEQVHALSLVIQERLLKLPQWKEIETIAVYSSVRNEVDMTLVFMKALEQGKTVYFPRVEQGLKFYEINDPTQLKKGAWAIPEPMDGCTAVADINKIDLIVVPGLVFDKAGHRLGYGRGFYDSILKDYRGFAVGVAFDFQIVDQIPCDNWDQRVKKIITEKREIQTGS